MTAQDIKELRQRLGMSQEGLALAIGLSQGQMSRLERGAVEACPLVIKRLNQLECHKTAKGTGQRAVA